MVRSGQAFTYRHYLKKCDDATCLGAESEAGSSRLGVWAVPSSITRPWDWRHSWRGRSTSASWPTEPAPGGSIQPRAEATTWRYRCKEIGSSTRAHEDLRHGHTYLDREASGWPASRSGEGWWRIAPHLGCNFGCSLGAEGTQTVRERPSHSNGSQPFSLLSIVSPILHRLLRLSGTPFKGAPPSAEIGVDVRQLCCSSASGLLSRSARARKPLKPPSMRARPCRRMQSGEPAPLSDEVMSRW